MVTGTAMSSEVSLSMAMVSLPVGGTMTRMACGSTTRRIVLRRLMPSACAASAWPVSTDRMPARAISAMYAASDSPRPSMPAMKPLTMVVASRPRNRVSQVEAEQVADLLVERHAELERPYRMPRVPSSVSST